jgi:hypothetical protein
MEQMQDICRGSVGPRWMERTQGSATLNWQIFCLIGKPSMLPSFLVNLHFMKVSTEIDNNFGYENNTQLVDNIPLNGDRHCTSSCKSNYYAITTTTTPLGI